MYSPYKEAQKLGILVGERNLPKHIKGYYDYSREPPVIVIEKRLSEAEKKCVLAHEIEHHLYPTFHGARRPQIYHEVLTRNRDEREITKRALLKLIPKKDLVRFIKSLGDCANIFEIAQHFGITEEWARLRMDIYLSGQNRGR